MSGIELLNSNLEKLNGKLEKIDKLKNKILNNTKPDKKLKEVSNSVNNLKKEVKGLKKNFKINTENGNLNADGVNFADLKKVMSSTISSAINLSSSIKIPQTLEELKKSFEVFDYFSNYNKFILHFSEKIENKIILDEKEKTKELILDFYDYFLMLDALVKEAYKCFDNKKYEDLETKVNEVQFKIKKLKDKENEFFNYYLQDFHSLKIFEHIHIKFKVLAEIESNKIKDKLINYRKIKDIYSLQTQIMIMKKEIEDKKNLLNN